MVAHRARDTLLLLLLLLLPAVAAVAAASMPSESGGAAAAPAAAGSPHGECQPKGGIHRHQPQFHIIAPMFAGGGLNGTSWPGGVNDVNAVFQHQGVWHIMHQCDGGDAGVPCGGGWEGPTKHPDPRTQRYYHSWGHVVSTDLVRWKRLPDALAPNVTNFEHGADCDGSISFPAGVGPIMMYGPGCGYHGPDGVADAADRLGLGDAPVVGVALPENSSDPELERWVHEWSGPVTFAASSPPCSFAGSVWQHGDHWSLICTADGTRARYTASVAGGGAAGLAGPWSRADAAFGGNSSSQGRIGGNSGPAFLPLPPPSTTPLLEEPRHQGTQPTHVMSDGAGSTFSVGTFDQQTEVFRATAQFKTDLGKLGWTAGGLAEDGRVLLVGWVAGGNDPPTHAAGCPTIGGIKVCGVQAESAVRVLSWEASTQRLLANPPVEMAGLRNATLCNISSVALKNGSAVVVLPLPEGTGAAVDVEIEVSLPPAASAPGFSFGVRVFASRQPYDDDRMTMEQPPPSRILNGTNFRGGNVGIHPLPAGTPDAAGHTACDELCGARSDCTAWVLVKAGKSGPTGKQPECALKGRSYCVNALSHPCTGCEDEGGKAGQCYCDAGIKPGITPPAPGKCGGSPQPPPPPPASDEGVAVVIQVSAAAKNGSRLCSVVVAGRRCGTFPLLAGESSMAVRVLVDRSIAEFFFAGGRAVYTARSYPALGADGVELFVPSGADKADEEGGVVVTAVAYEMGCGWED